MEKICATCRAFCEHLSYGQCRLHPQMVPTSYDYWCLDWQPKERPLPKPDAADKTLDARKASGEEEFAQFWAVYPDKTGKKAARKAFQNARDRPRIDDLLKAIEMAKQSKRWREGFIPLPTTWLNQGRWADVPTETKPTVFEEFLARGGECDEIK